MPIYHLSIKTVSRSEGRSATAAAAYRSADKITDERTSELHDYTRKGGVAYSEILLPNNAPEWARYRSQLWNEAEQAENRKNSTVAREFEIALPSELPEKERQRLALDFAKEIVERHQVAADVAIHEPSRGGDNRNHHAHILITTRQLTETGFTKKTRELDDRKSGEVDRWRERYAALQNEFLKQNGIDETVSHKSLKAQGIDREPTKHLGVKATNYERRTGKPSTKRLDFEQQADERLNAKKEISHLESEAQQTEQAIKEIRKDTQDKINAEKMEAERLKLVKEQERIAEEQRQLALLNQAKADSDTQQLKATIKAEASEIAAKFRQERAERAAALERQKQADAKRNRPTKKPKNQDLER